MLPTRPQWCLLLSHDEDRLEGFLLGRGDASYSAMTKQSRRVFYSATAMPPTQPWRSRLGGSSTWLRRCLLPGRGDVSYSAMTKPSHRVFHLVATMPSTRLRRCLLLGRDEAELEGLLIGHDEAKSEGLLLSHSDTSYSVTMKLSGMAFYSAVVKSPIPPWRCGVEKPSTRPRQHLRFVYDEVEL